MPKYYLRFIYAPLFILILTAGCFSKPDSLEKGPGSLRLTIKLAETSNISTQASASEVQQFQVKLKQGQTLEIEKFFPCDEGLTETVITELYPGSWRMEVSALDSSSATIFFGSGSVTIEPGATAVAEIILRAANGFIEVIFDSSRLAIGSQYTTGSFYAYLNPTDSKSTRYELSRENDLFKAKIGLPEGNFQAKIAIPQYTGAVYESTDYIDITIRSGKTTSLTIAPDSSVNLIGTIDSTPEVPTGLTAAYQAVPPTKVNLAWNPVPDLDLAGFHIYRRDHEGRMLRTATVTKEVTSYSDPVSDSLFTNGKISYTVTSYDLGGNESCWSGVVTVSK